MKSMSKSRAIWKPKVKNQRVYTLEVFITSGPISEKFARKNPVVSRIIQISGSQTLQDLHHAIFDAFEREDEHMYEFQFGGKGPMDSDAKSYVLPMAVDDPFSDGEEKSDLTRTTIGSLGFKIGDAFGYWFDFGDDWWHQINVVAIEEKPSGKYPRIVKRVGASPPQYPDWDGEE